MTDDIEDDINQFGFILDFYTEQSIDEIISDIHQLNSGFEYLYVVDTFDIVENYLPYTEVELFSGNATHTKIQKFLCYDYFFGKTSTIPIILLDEYKIELLAAKNKLIQHLKQANIVLDNIKKLKESTKNFTINSKVAQMFFIENLEMFMLLMILDSKKNNVIKEFYNLLKERLSISEIKLQSKVDTLVVSEIFENSKVSNNATKIFEAFVDNNIYKLLSTPTNKLNDRHIFLENTFRDIQAIDRIRQINEKLAETDLSYFVIYLSSAYKTNEICKIFDKKLNVELSFHRNIYQLFLYDRISSEFNEDLEKGIKVLEKIKELILKLKSNVFDNRNLQEPDIETNKTLVNIKKIFNYESTQVNAHFFLGAYIEKYGELFQSNVKNNICTEAQSKSILNFLEEVSDSSERHNSNLFDVNLGLSQMYQTVGVANNIENFKNFNPEYFTGMDIIKNPYQHLPNLLFFDDLYNSNLKEKLYDFIYENIEITNKNIKKIIESFNALIDEFASHQTNSTKSKLQKSILLTYLNLIAQDRKVKTIYKENRSMEEYLIADLEILKLNLGLDNKKLVHKKEGKYIDIVKIGINPLEIEVIYLLIWLYRRNNKEDAAITIGLEFLHNNSYEEDFRISQGIALAYISKFYKKKKNNESKEQVKLILEKAIFHLEKTIGSFQRRISYNILTKENCIVLKNYIAILNSITDMCIREFELSNESNYIQIEHARKYINEIKSIFLILNLDYNLYPTYSVTELELEFHEINILLKNKKETVAINKLSQTILRKDYLKQSDNLSQFVDEYFTAIIHRIEFLASTILENKK